MSKLKPGTKKLKTLLLLCNAVLLFIVAFLIGSQMARAQSSTSVPTAAQLEALRDRPYTAQYPEFQDQISATVIPENPSPNEIVQINLEVYSYDINSALITWKVNGKSVASAIGQKSFSFKAGKAGQTTKIDVTINPRDRPAVSQTFTFTPGEVDLLWQSDVYTHPFYKGKKLYTPESTLTFVAMPRNARGTIRPSETVFNWRVNGTVQGDKSGFGKNTYVFEGPIIIQPVEVQVETYSPTPGAGDQKETATSNITVEPKSPGIRLYENSALYGILFNKALRGNITINKPEMSISAYPYFQTIPGKNSGTIYTWLVDDYGVPIPPNQNTVTLRRTEGDRGESYVAVQSENPMKILQTVETDLKISFDKRSAAQSGQGFGQ